MLLTIFLTDLPGEGRDEPPRTHGNLGLMSELKLIKELGAAVGTF